MSIKLLLQQPYFDPAEVRRLQNDLDPIRRKNMREKQVQIGALAQVNGQVRADGNYYWVHLPAGMDGNGNALYGAPFLARAPANGASVLNYAGFPVTLGVGLDNQLEITGVDAPSYAGAGGNLQILNPLREEQLFTRLEDAMPLQSRPLGSDAEASTVVQVRKLYYVDDYGDLQRYQGTELAADKVDIASYIPAADYHRLVVVFLRTYDDTIQVIGSTARALTTAIVLPDDLQECFAGRGAETIPCQAYYLANNQSNVDIGALHVDLRQWINVPRGLGLQNPMSKNHRIRSGQTVSHIGKLTVTGNLSVQGDLRIRKATSPVISKPIGPVYFAPEALVSTAAASQLSVVTSAINNGGVYQSSPADGQTVFSSKCYLIPGVYQVRALYSKDADRAIFKTRFSGPATVTTATTDAYAASASYNNVSDNNVTITKPGEYQVDVLTDGKNASSSDYVVFLQSLTLTRQ